MIGTCRRVAKGSRYVCSECGYGAGDERWRYCPSCGRKYVFGEVERAWEKVGRKVAR